MHMTIAETQLSPLHLSATIEEYARPQSDLSLVQRKRTVTATLVCRD